jgi:hypothetical protein
LGGLVVPSIGEEVSWLQYTLESYEKHALGYLEPRRRRDQRERDPVRGDPAADTKSLFHKHENSDEVAWVLARRKAGSRPAWFQALAFSSPG